jgi:hypothetical protein
MHAQHTCHASHSVGTTVRMYMCGLVYRVAASKRQCGVYATSIVPFRLGNKVPCLSQPNSVLCEPPSLPPSPLTRARTHTRALAYHTGTMLATSSTAPLAGWTRTRTPCRKTPLPCCRTAPAQSLPRLSRRRPSPKVRGGKQRLTHGWRSSATASLFCQPLLCVCAKRVLS